MFWEENVYFVELAAYHLVRVGFMEKEEYKGITLAILLLFLIFAFIGDPGSSSYH